MAGRYPILNNLGEEFLKAYTDPLISQEDVCARFGIQKSTFYNYEKELALPKLRVGVGFHTVLPRHKFLKGARDAMELYEVEFLRRLAVDLRVKIKVVPLFSGDASPEKQLLAGNIDFLLSGLSKTEARARDMCFSDQYVPKATVPRGRLICKKGFRVESARPLLGVVQNTVHDDYARKHLHREFAIKAYPSLPRAIEALRRNNLSFLLCHPSALDLYKEDMTSMVDSGREYKYDTHSGVAFRRGFDEWLEPVNRIIARMQEEETVEDLFLECQRQFPLTEW